MQKKTKQNSKKQRKDTAAKVVHVFLCTQVDVEGKDMYKTLQLIIWAKKLRTLGR